MEETVLISTCVRMVALNHGLVTVNAMWSATTLHVKRMVVTVSLILLMMQSHVNVLGSRMVMDLVAAARIGTRIPVVPGATHHKVHAQIKCLHGGVVCIIHTSLVLESHRHQRGKSQ